MTAKLAFARSSRRHFGSLREPTWAFSCGSEGFARWHTLCSKLVVVFLYRVFSCLVHPRSLLWVALLLVSVATPVQAQQLSLKSQSYRVERKVERDSSKEPYAISRQDCLDDDPTLLDYDPDVKDSGRTWVRFTIYLDGDIPNNSQIEIWASQGADCTDTNSRTNGLCHRVYIRSKANAIQVSDVAHVYPRVVLSEKDVAEIDVNDPTSYPSIEDVCNDDVQQTYTFSIMLFKGSKILTHVEWTDTRVDLRGPDPPTSIKGSPGEASIYLTWDIPSELEDSDTQGFDFYCSPADGSDPAANGGAGGATAACGSKLVPGRLPPAGTKCGSASGKGTRKGLASGLTNGTTYAVGIAARDLVTNSGLLSEVDCVTPEEVTSFFEDYKHNGGKGGGGYCAHSKGRAVPTGWALLLFPLFIVLTFLRRRARRQLSTYDSSYLS